MTAPVPEARRRAASAARPRSRCSSSPRRATWWRSARASAATRRRAAFARNVTRALASPLVLDADGLFAFVDALAELRARRAPTVLTPHPGRGGAAARQHGGRA